MSGITSMDELRAKIDSMGEEEVTEETPQEEVTEETPQEEVKEEEVPEVEAFVPEKTYKSLGEEKEYDKFLIDSIKTPEQMDTLKRLYQKANGLDHYQLRNTELKQTNENLVSENDSFKNEMGYYNKLLQNKDHHTFFRNVNITDDDILKVAQNIIQYGELTPNQQQAYDSNIINTQKVYNLESENQRLQEGVINQNAGAQIQELDNYLLGDTVSNTVNAFDQRIGQIGAFRAEVINRAAMIEKSTGRTLSMEDAVNEVLNLVGPAPVAVSEQNGNSGITSPSQPQTRVVVKKSHPTLPNLKSGGQSPAKRVVKSLADLRKIADGLDDY